MLRLFRSNNALVCRLLIFIIFATIALTLIEGLKLKLDEAMPEAPSQRSAMACAISKLAYGNGNIYTGFNRVNDELRLGGILPEYDPWYPMVTKRLGITSSLELHRSKSLINAALQKASHLHEPFEHYGSPIMRGESKGICVYYYLSFLLFGYNIAAPFFFFFFLVFVSALLFVATFRQNRDSLSLCLLCATALFVVVKAIPVVGLELMSVHNYRVLPVIAMIPGLHLFLLMIEKVNKTVLVKLGAFIQSLFIIFAYHIRETALWIPLFFGTMLFLFCLVKYRGVWFPRLHQLQLKIWPAVLVLCCLAGLKIYEGPAYHGLYNSVDSHHMLWHNLYLGLCATPAPDKNLCVGNGDEMADNAARAYVKEKTGRDPGQYCGNFVTYNYVIRMAYLRILKRRPWFVMKTHFYQIYSFMDNYSNYYFLKSSMFLMLFIGLIIGLFCRPNKRGLMPITCILLALSFSFLINFLAYAAPYAISEPAFLTTLTLGYSVALLVGWLVTKFEGILQRPNRPI